MATLLSFDGAYGGPLTVAVEQCEALAARGHEVTLVVGWDGRAHLDATSSFRIRPVPVRRVVPVAGVIGYFGSAALAAAREVVSDFDLAHVHFGRDLFAMHAAHRAVDRIPLVLQTHGMVMPDHRPKSRVSDVVTVRRTLSRADAVLCLTADEERGVRDVSRGAANTVRLTNGIRPASTTARRRPPREGTAEVMFCARLHARKRPLAFVDMARLLHADGVAVRFRMAGPDEGMLPELEKAISAARDSGVDIEYLGALEPGRVRARLTSSDVFVLPSIDEPFPMTVLEALSIGTPAVITNSCGLADHAVEGGFATVTDPGVPALAAAVRRLVGDPAHWSTMSAAGMLASRTSLSVDGVVTRLESVYDGAVARTGHQG